MNKKIISSATATRDLKEATEKGILIKNGEGRVTVYQYNIL
jgi:Fic family protein